MSTPSLFPEDPSIELHITLDWSKGRITFDWKSNQVDKKLAHGAVWVANGLLRWRITGAGQADNFDCLIEPTAIETAIHYVARHLRVAKRDVSVFGRRFNPILNAWERERLSNVREPWKFLAGEVLSMGKELMDARSSFEPAPIELLERSLRREERLELETIRERVLDPYVKNRKQMAGALHRAPKSRPQAPEAPVLRTKPMAPIPEVRLEIAAAEMPSYDLFHAHSRIESFLRIERASLMWISNQSDDLLCLPNCAIDHLDYQVRTALRVTGALRGRALLSDEVGLGKTIEAGLVLKEYVTRGMVRRFLVLTVPSLVDQWAEELESKFSLSSATSNQPQFRVNPERFWTEENAIIASIHTFKQESHLALAARRPWDMVVVDEAHYLRNRTSKAWQAVNALPRQFLYC